MIVRRLAGELLKADSAVCDASASLDLEMPSEPFGFLNNSRHRDTQPLADPFEAQAHGAQPLELLACLRHIEKRGIEETAKRTLQAFGRVLRYTVAAGRADRDFTLDLDGALRLAPFVFVRPGDLRQAEWTEFGRWLICCTSTRTRYGAGTGVFRARATPTSLRRTLG